MFWWERGAFWVKRLSKISGKENLLGHPLLKKSLWTNFSPPTFLIIVTWLFAVNKLYIPLKKTQGPREHRVSGVSWPLWLFEIVFWKCNKKLIFGLKGYIFGRFEVSDPPDFRSSRGPWKNYKKTFSTVCSTYFYHKESCHNDKKCRWRKSRP